MTRERVTGAALVATLVAFAFVAAWQQKKIREQQAVIDAKGSEVQQQLDGGIVRASSTQVSSGGSADRAADAGVDIGVVKDDAKAHGADINSVNVTTAVTRGKSAANLGSTGQQPRANAPPAATCSLPVPPSKPSPSPDDAAPGDDKWGYTRARQFLTLTEPVPGGAEVPFGTVGFSAWQKAPWDITVVPRTYKLVTVGAVTDEGKHYAYSKMTVEVDGRSYPVIIDKAEYVEDAPSGKFRWRLKPALAVDAALNVRGAVGTQVLAGAQVALAGYGIDPKLPEWLFILVGIAYEARSEGGAITFTPVSWNMGEAMPLIDNLYVGPTVSLTSGGVVGIGGGVRVGL